MPEASDKLLPPVLLAMSALDDAISEHGVLAERLANAVRDATRLDEHLRRIGFEEHENLKAATKALAFAISMVQRIAWREEAARAAKERAQERLLEIRKAQNRSRSELLRIELEIDAASIWDMVGRFEAQVRARLTEHAKIAAEMNFAASAAGEPSAAALEAASLAPALGTSGPELWSALAGGVRQLYDRNGAQPHGSSEAAPRRSDFEGAPQRSDFQPAVNGFDERRRPLLLPEAANAEPIRARAAVIDASVTPAPPPRSPPAPGPASRPRPAAVAPPPPPDAYEPRFDFARPQVMSPKTEATPPPFLARGTPPGSPGPAKADSLPEAAENKRGRLDRMLRNLAGMVGARRV
jgi:hypothetical protein